MIRPCSAEGNAKLHHQAGDVSSDFCLQMLPDESWIRSLNLAAQLRNCNLIKFASVCRLGTTALIMRKHLLGRCTY